MATHVFLFLILVPLVCGAENYSGDRILDKLSSGMKFAQNFLGSESVALKVAEFVVRAFQTEPNRRQPPQYYPKDSFEDTQEKQPYQDAQESVNPMKHLVKLFGLQPPQLSAVAVNALVFFAQMISTFFSGPKRRNKPYRFEDPMKWILNKNSNRLQDIILEAKNESLPKTLDDFIQEKGNVEETSCIRLLVCKITPFVSKMQKTVFGTDKDGQYNNKDMGVLYRHLPSKDEIFKSSDSCEAKHKECDLNSV